MLGEEPNGISHSDSLNCLANTLCCLYQKDLSSGFSLSVMWLFQIWAAFCIHGQGGRETIGLESIAAENKIFCLAKTALGNRELVVETISFP